MRSCRAALRRSKPIRAASSNSLSQGMSSSDELFTAGPAPAIATCCALHKRLPRPTLEPGVGRRAPPLSVYGPLSFLAHAAQIAPARITVIDSAMLASRVSSVRFQAESPHSDYSKSLSGETFLGPHVLYGPDDERECQEQELSCYRCGEAASDGRLCIWAYAHCPLSLQTARRIAVPVGASTWARW